jgi:hypothetical protein
MDDALHPSTLSEILDRTIQIYRKRFLVFLGVAVVPYAAVLVPIAVLLLLGFWLGASGGSGTATAGSVLLIGVVVLVAMPTWIAVTGLTTAALSHGAWQSYLTGERITIRGLYREVWARGWSYAGLYFLQALLIWGVPVFAWVLLVGVGAGMTTLMRSGGMGVAGGVVFGTTMFVGVVLMIAYMVWMLLRLSLAFAAAVVERGGAVDALKRSTALSSGTKGRIVLLYLLGTILNYVITFSVTFPLTIVLGLIPSLHSQRFAQIVAGITFVVVYGMAFAAQALIKPVYAIALVMFYFDQRIRKEGFDIEWLMQRAGLSAPVGAATEAAPWMPATPRTVLGAEGAAEVSQIPSLDATVDAAPRSGAPAAAAPGEI